MFRNSPYASFIIVTIPFLSTTTIQSKILLTIESSVLLRSLTSSSSEATFCSSVTSWNIATAPTILLFLIIGDRLVMICELPAFILCGVSTIPVSSTRIRPVCGITSLIERPTTFSAFMPVIVWAAGLKIVTLPAALIAMTPLLTECKTASNSSAIEIDFSER